MKWSPDGVVINPSIRFDRMKYHFGQLTIYETNKYPTNHFPVNLRHNKVGTISNYFGIVRLSWLVVLVDWLAGRLANHVVFIRCARCAVSMHIDCLVIICERCACNEISTRRCAPVISERPVRTQTCTLRCDETCKLHKMYYTVAVVCCRDAG